MFQLSGFCCRDYRVQGLGRVLGRTASTLSGSTFRRLVELY